MHHDQDGLVVGAALVFGARGQGRLKCGGTMKIVAFIKDYVAGDGIIDHLNLTFVADKSPPSRVFEQVALMAAEEQAKNL